MLQLSMSSSPVNRMKQWRLLIRSLKQQGLQIRSFSQGILGILILVHRALQIFACFRRYSYEWPQIRRIDCE